ncbi:hypothetical protein LBO01_02950 [Companilactobacillus paralimentarius]|uniref:Glucose 1-dehydrogenase (NAD(P)(+)) n=2 Tax=Companilactobacillus bobalius TaxID=2801451 RepID=A0A202FFG5_9LACO|nr:hypothetical protein FC78_GL001930 [Companilactobacillus bobalius DSM 19674]OVE99190.1 Glucose 1-dehydrogenase (NAD(P)(+)) [Companilactobacillus bobalius]GEO57166.1 hypothetical protein LBO01_02950 [Companilactobacillus paralimentarius]
MYEDLNNKVAVITGGSKGIGTAISERFGKERSRSLSTTTAMKMVLKKQQTK